MLKFAVVHVQPGPMRGDPVLYAPDLLSGTEDSVLSGPMRFDLEFPYGGRGPDVVRDEEDEEEEVERKEPERILVKMKPPIVASVDFNGPFSEFPQAAGNFLNRLSRSGVRLHLVSGMGGMERRRIERFAKLHGFEFQTLSFSMGFMDGHGDFLEEAMVGCWKAERLSSIGASLAVEGNPVHISQMVKRVPNLVVLKPVEV